VITLFPTYEGSSSWHHGGVSEHLPDALFGGFDGTESPEPLPDPSGRAGWRDAPELPPFTLPAFPNTRLMREAIAAALGEDPIGPVDQDPGAMPAQQPAAQPNVAPPSVAQPNVAQPNVGQPNVAQPNIPLANITAPLPRPASQVGGPWSGAPGRSVRPIVPTPVPSAQPPPTRRPRGLRYRPPLAAGSRTPVQLGDLRRRVGRARPNFPLQTHSNGGAGAFFVITLIIFTALAYGVISGIAEAIARLIP
jgi:hypothetical protein